MKNGVYYSKSHNALFIWHSPFMITSNPKAIKLDKDLVVLLKKSLRLVYLGKL